MKLATIGYEDASLQDTIDRLKAAGVKTVIDVRAVASSRRPGFSKSMLAASLKAQGIDYVHLRQLGTPKAGREAARSGRIAEMNAIFDAHMEEPAPQLELQRAEEIAAQGKSALLCYESDPKGCHRSNVAERLRARRAFDVENL